MHPEREQDLLQLAEKLSHSFSDLALLHAALMHSSYVHENPGLCPQSNERLEFLGDAVLELVITEHLYANYPQCSEGELSKARSATVNETNLANCARELELGRYLLLGKGEVLQGGAEKPSILSDALEAVTAAIYLDAGLEAAREVLLGLLGEADLESLSLSPGKDYKTRLQELVQEQRHITPRYHLVGASGPDHAKEFTVALRIGSDELARGVGRSKKEAEQKAARTGLARLKTPSIAVKD